MKFAPAQSSARGKLAAEAVRIDLYRRKRRRDILETKSREMGSGTSDQGIIRIGILVEWLGG